MVMRFLGPVRSQIVMKITIRLLELAVGVTGIRSVTRQTAGVDQVLGHVAELESGGRDLTGDGTTTTDWVAICWRRQEPLRGVNQASPRQQLDRPTSRPAEPRGSPDRVCRNC